MTNPDTEKAVAPAFDVFNVYFDRIYEPTMHIFLDFNGRLDENTFKCAVMMYTKNNPYASSRFVKKEGSFFWEKMPEIKYSDLFSVKYTTGSKKCILENPPERVDVYKGPQIKTCILREDSHDSVVISCHHGFSDASGLMRASEEIFHIYTKLIEDPNYQTSPKGWYYRETGRILEKFPEEVIEHELDSEEPFTDRWAFPFEHTGHGIPRISILTLSRKRLSAIKKFGKKYGATVNDMIAGAFFLALLKINSCDSAGESEKSILTAADVRKYYGRENGKNPQNLSIAYQLSVTARKNSTLSDILEQITSVTKRKKSGNMGLGCIAFYEDIYSKGPEFIENFFDRMMASYEKNNFKNPVFSNIGIIKAENYYPVLGPDKKKLSITDAFFIPVVSWPPGFLVTVSTFNDSITLESGYEDGPFSKEKVETILSYIDSFLPA
ncbi:NRPS condensation-like uncharacterized protein [Methanomicrobium sp. W14]|uniref:condensation protein n=1 Tax=Methanomicrobium sp. W14 TaxID=2817839 RepID=UPI001AE207D2|nr:condensation protein [Methanomicrobium sp. W14]MBP2132320.1 NRPS condensation-like uncharacterized protein [Methanomicrobium sp. W14]